MEDRERDRRRENRNGQGGDPNPNDPLAGILWGIGSLALAGGAVYAASRYFSGGEPEGPPSTRAGAGQSMTVSANVSGSTITIAVDATPSRAGGLLVIPAQEKVYFYSIDWSEFPTFAGEPDKFEMINALLGLSIFEKYVASYRGSRDEVILKTDSTFCQNPVTVYRRQKDAGWKQFFSGVDSKLKREPFEGEWQYKLRNTDDHLRIADKLSRANHSNSASLPVAVLGAAGNNVMGYTPFNVSKGHVSLLQGIARQVLQVSSLTCEAEACEVGGEGSCQTT